MSPNSVRIGALVRSYAKTPEQVPDVVKRAVASAKLASSLTVKGSSFFRRLAYLVPVDYDCGKTEDALLEAFSVEQVEAFVWPFPGHHSCGVLNSALRLFYASGMTHAAIISNKAAGYLTEKTAGHILDAISHNAKAVGVVTDELGEYVLEGRVQNTFAVWDIEALLGLDPPGFDNEGGVEEVAPLIRLVRKHRRCIAVIDPAEKPALDLRQSKDGKARHEEVMQTKLARQEGELKRLDASFDCIRGGVLVEYSG